MAIRGASIRHAEIVRTVLYAVQRMFFIACTCVPLVSAAAFAVAAPATNGDLLLELNSPLAVAGTPVNDDREVQGWLSNYLMPMIMSGGEYSLAFSPDAVPRTAAEDLSAAYCYPNPCRTYRGDTAVTFTRLPSQTYLRIFTITGELVYDRHETSDTGDVSWGLVNNEGASVASGVYVYLLTDRAGRTAVGKVSVIR